MIYIVLSDIGIYVVGNFEQIYCFVTVCFDGENSVQKIQDPINTLKDIPLFNRFSPSVSRHKQRSHGSFDHQPVSLAMVSERCKPRG